MSTTVSYKGSTIATLSNETKTLTTAGTWVEGDISITDSGGTAAISVVDTTDSHGGTIREITAIDISDTTAVAGDVASGKYFYTAGGIKTIGTLTESGSSGQTVTGTFTGDNGITVQIPCSFAPDVIYIYGDLTDDVAYRGINSISIIKDNALYVISDTSASTTTLNATYFNSDITGYNESNSSVPHASYSNGVLTVDMVDNTSSNRFTSGITYTYKLSTLGSGTPSATAHTIYFEFSDSTNTTITAYYDDSFISSAITATTPTTYNNKTVTLAELDEVAWYEPTNIPLNTELVDFSKVLTGYATQSSGAIEATGQSWDAVTDYILIDPSMTFTFKCNDWYNIGFYDSSKNSVRVVRAHDIGTSFNNDIATGTLNLTNIPSNAAYIVLPGNSYNLQVTMSLIRTA